MMRLINLTFRRLSLSVFICGLTACTKCDQEAKEKPKEPKAPDYKIKFPKAPEFLEKEEVYAHVEKIWEGAFVFVDQGAEQSCIHYQKKGSCKYLNLSQPGAKIREVNCKLAFTMLQGLEINFEPVEDIPVVITISDFDMLENTQSLQFNPLDFSSGTATFFTKPCFDKQIKSAK